MRPGGGKAKGASFEREVCVALSLWVSDGASEDLFWRSAMSGGRSTRGAKAGKDLRRQAGDISAVSAEGCSLTDRFYIECKHVKDLGIASFFLKRTGPLAKFWHVAMTEAILHRKQPMLIARQNLMPAFVLTYIDDPLIQGEVQFMDCQLILLSTMLARKYAAPIQQ